MTQRALLGLAALSVATAANAASLTLAQNYSGSTLYVTLQLLTTSNLTIFSALMGGHSSTALMPTPLEMYCTKLENRRPPNSWLS